jgi:universal stress protein E
MDRMNSILVGVDFSGCSKVALGQALRIAAWNRARVGAVHILDTLVMADVEFAMAAFQADIRDTMVKDAQDFWANFSREVPGAESVRFEVEIGHPVVTLLDKVREIKPDLLVLGMTGTGAGSGAGTVAAAAVRKAPAKTLLVRDTHTGPYKTVVVGVDFSETSMIALQQAARLAAQDSAALHVVHVFDAPWHQLHYRAPTPQATPDFRDQYTRTVQQRLEGFAPTLEHELRFLKPVYKLIDHRSHGRGLTEYVRSIGADLVVIGTRGRTNIRDIVMGSTAERVVRDAPCSILAVKPADMDESAKRA